MNFIAIDFETANSERTSACSIGLTEVCNGEIVDTVQHLIRPSELKFGWWQKRNLNIRIEDLANAPTLSELWPSIRHLIEDRLLVAHNATYDMSVLRRSLHANSIKVPSVRFICSCHVARQVWPELTNHKLDFLASTFGLELKHHSAGSDSRAAASLILNAASARGIGCPIALANSLNVSIGTVYSHEEWISSTGPAACHESELIQITLREDFDVSLHPFYGKNVAFTEPLEQLSRDEAGKIVEMFGGTTHDSVTKKTHFLVVGSLSPGRTTTKLEKARAQLRKGCDISIISDADFMGLFLDHVNIEAS